ncbi:ATP-binding protein [Streptomyces sp. NPDC058695]|uniref:ATP-binding protein n=1 Tax=Streptomyces sp. NPDC058695 TaxID=3346604 RepID=UPI00365FC374
MTLPGRSYSRDTPRRARAYVRDFLREWNVPESVVEVLALAVSEFASNALAHVDHDTVDVRVSVTEDEAVVSVTDRGLSGLPTVSTETLPDDEHGRGLALVEALADRLEVLAHQQSTEVLAAVALPGHARDTGRGGTSDDDAPRAHG